MLHVLDVCKKDAGKIWHRKPSPNADSGLLLSITHSTSSALAISSRNVRFLQSAFDVSGNSFVGGDHQGNLYLFDLNKNRFSLVQRTGAPCTALAFSLRRRSEFLVGMADYSLKCFDTETQELVAWMKGHSQSIQGISIHASGRFALTYSGEAAQLWDLDSFQRKRKLNIKEDVGITKVFFLPMSNTIITCFQDDSIFAWESESLACKYQLKLPPGKSPNFKAFAASRDGRVLVGGGRSRHLHVFNLETQKLLRVVELPDKVKSVKQLYFLPDSFDGGANQVLCALGQDGVARFVNINTCQQVFDLGSASDRVNSVTISPTGRHVVCVMDSGNLNIYSVAALTSELNKPPPPLMKILKGNNKNETEKKVTTRKPKQVTIKGKENKPNTASIQSEMPDGINIDKLMSILKGYGEFPEKYRLFIWRCILRLPENHAGYAALVDKGTHPAYQRLHEQYPIKSRKLLRVLQRTLSALAHWSPIFGETDFLPMLAFPIVKLFQNNQLVCFEVVATFLVNWAQHWFEYFPNPAINVLGMVENVLAYHDKDLLQHLIAHGVTSQVYAWPLLETVFSEVLTKEEWLKLFDNLLSNPPAYMLMLVVAYCTTSRAPLLRCQEFDDFKFFFHHRNAVSVKAVIKEAYRLMEATPDDIHPAQSLEEFAPLTKGQYPVFNKYPKFIVDYQVQERERIRLEEMEYLRQRQSSLELQKETSRRQQEEEAWYRQQKLLLEAEEKRRTMIQTEEQKLVDQRSRLAALNREVKTKELQLLDATRRKFMLYQQQQKEAQLARLDDEIHRKATMRDIETQAAVEDADIRHMELEVQRKLFEQELHRNHVDAQQQENAEDEARRHQAEIEDRIQRGVNAAEKEREANLRKNMQQSLARAEQLNADAAMKTELETRHLANELDREAKAVKLAQMQNENRRLERSIHEIMRDVQLRREWEAENAGTILSDQQAVGIEAEARRLALLQDEADAAQSHVHHIQGTQQDMFERLRDLRQHLRRQGVESATVDNCLNNSGSTDVSAQFSLDRGRNGFEDNERTLMSGVRELRTRLAREGRERRPPPQTVSLEA